MKIEANKILFCLVLAVMMAMPLVGWGQTKQTGLSGVYYIANYYQYSSTDHSVCWYMVPAKDPQQENTCADAYYSPNCTACNPEKPFITTYQTNRNDNDTSIWILKEIDDESGFYYMIHAMTGKYLVYEPPFSGGNSGNGRRKSFHLQTQADLVLDDSAKFEITNVPSTVGDWHENQRLIRIKKLTSDNRFLNPAGGHYNLYHANGGGNPGHYIGLVGVYGSYDGGANNGDRNTRWYLERTLMGEPTISDVSEYNTITITDANNLPTGYTIHYTTDGNDPTAASPEYSGPIVVTSNWTVKAVVVRYGLVLTEVATKSVSPVVATPVISFDYLTSKVSISCTTPLANIFYNTGDGSQADPTTSTGTQYENPFDVTSPTTVKAISSLGTEVSSVATLAITQVATPTIQNNGSNAISITSATDGATIYYTTDGSTPNTSSTEYTEPLTENVSNVTINAIAVKENMITSAMGSGCVMLQCAEPVITKTSDNTFTISCGFPASGVTIYYEMGESPSDPTTSSSYIASGGTVTTTFPTTIKAMATASNYNNSEVSEKYISVAPDYSGYFYLQSQGDATYYMIPSETHHPDNNNPLVQTKKEQKLASVWQIQKDENTDYYRIIHYSDSKYMVADKTALTQSVWLQDTNPGNGTELFELEVVSSGIFNIKPKDAANEDDKNYLNVTEGNGNNHTIGLWTADNNNSKWAFTNVPAQPTIAVNDLRVTMTNIFNNGSIYYTIDGTTPTSGSTQGTSVTLEYGPQFTVNAICVYDVPEPDWVSDVATTTVQVPLLIPVFTRNGNTVSISSTQKVANPSKVDFWYTIEEHETRDVPIPGDTDHGQLYSTPITLTTGRLYIIKAIAYNPNSANPADYTSEVAILVVDLRDPTVISSFAGIIDVYGYYKFADNFEATGTPSDDIGTTANPFRGTLDGNMVAFELGNDPLFDCVEDATIKNMNITSVSISTSGDAGAIANVAQGDTRIYNCGVLAGTVSGSDNVGGLVGSLKGSSRVINCFSYANITGGNLVGGIVGKNYEVTTSTNLKTMVMNCMFYGDITGGNSKAPIYNGEIITNRSDASGVSNFNYFWAEASYVQEQDIDVYNCALAAETRFLQRFEFFRHLLNSNRALAAWWVTGDINNKDEMMKWVLEPSQIGTSTPYPILKPPYDSENHIIQYPSVVNIDAAHAEAFDPDPAIAKTQYNQGRKFGTFTINIQNASSGAPDGANITTTSVTPNITDKDPAHFNFNYYKVQLPYYNDVGTHNYTGNKVVTGWKIVSIASGTHPFSTGSDASATVNDDGDITLTTPYNFADRKCTAKDLYSETNKRVFSQGAYFDVPEGVTSITIEPYWGKCVYVSDAYPDVVYNQGMSSASSVTNVGGGARYTNNTAYNINNSSQKVYTKFGGNDGAVANLNPSGTVYDNAIVLVGNFHSLSLSSQASDKPFTIMSIDLDKDNEPDYSYILRFDSRVRAHPVRVDFLNIIGLGMAQKSYGGTGTYNLGILQPLGWFEATNTSLFRFTQFEYDKKDRENAPMILHGGVIEQWVTVGGKEEEIKEGKTVTYYHVGSNVWFKEFHIGVHQDKIQDEFVSPHPPISVTGGDFEEFYLTGLYNTPNANYEDNAECYINGGHFGKIAGTGMQGIGKADGADNTGNIIWQIDNADIDEFYAGGINAAHVAEGNIRTVISNSRVDQFCGGLKFGDMNSDKTVVTNATNCMFRTFFGAGYGGNSYNRRYPDNKNNVQNINWNQWVAQQYTKKYDSVYGGVETRIDYQFIPMSGNTSNVARLFVDYVSFSLATSYDVTSKLTDCTITTSELGSLDLFSQCIGNFYGGGSLGKVAGPVKSTLTNCIVEGNVFGAGYSATVPSVAVMNNSFQTAPFYDANLGAYFEAVLPATVPYTWVQAETVNSTETAINTTTHKLFTTLDISKTNLGSVNGNTTLTLKGDTRVGTLDDENHLVEGTGSVYGGGDESVVSGDVTVTVQGNANISGNVFGGGNLGSVGGNTTVIIETDPDPGTQPGTTVTQNVFGGGNLAEVGGYTTVDINGGTVTQDVYGGGALADVVGNTTVNIMGGTVSRDIYGGGLGRKADAGNGIEAVEAKVYGTATVNIGIGTVSSTDPFINEVTGLDGSATIGGNVYGCNNANGSPQEDVTVNVFQTAHTATNMASYIEDDADYAIANVFGGGNEADFSVTGKTAYVNIYTCENTIGRVFGGGNAAAAPHVATEIQGGRLGQVFGGGNGELGPEYGADIGAGVDLTIHGGSVGEFYGGSNQNGVLQGDINVDVVNNGPCQTIEINDFFCGGNFVDISGNLTTDITCSQGMEVNNLYGGCNQADISGYVVLNVYGGTYTNVFGGSRGTSQKAADIGGDVTLNLYGGTIENVFGGSNINGNIGGSITVNVLDIEGECPLNITNIYGGSNLTSYEPDDATITSPVVNVVHIRNGIGGNVYGGSKGETGVTTNVISNPLVNIGYDATSMDGYIPATYLSTYSGLLAAPRAIVAGSVFGGGDAAVVQGNTAIFLRNKAKVFGNVYGGGNMGEVLGDTKVIVNGSH